MVNENLEDNKIVASVDVPTGYPPEMNAHHTAIIQYVESTPHLIGVSGAYRGQKQSFQESGQYCCRAGYHYRFWFLDETEAKEFAKEVGGRLEMPPVIPTRRK